MTYTNTPAAQVTGSLAATRNEQGNVQEITVHDFAGRTSVVAYDRTQTDDAIKDGDVLDLGCGNVAVLVKAWPTVVVGEIEGFHRLKAGVTFETLDDGKYAISAAKAREVSSKVRNHGNVAISIDHAASGKTGTFTAKYDQYAERSGQFFTVLGAVDPKTYDADECGEMFYIRFADGTEIEAWPEEVESALQGNVDGDMIREMYELASIATARSGATSDVEKFKVKGLLKDASDGWIDITPAGERVLESHCYTYDPKVGWQRQAHEKLKGASYMPTAHRVSQSNPGLSHDDVLTVADLQGSLLRQVCGDAQQLSVSAAEVVLIRDALANHRELLASTTSADREANGDCWADKQVQACDVLLAELNAPTKDRVNSPSPGI